MVSPPPSTLPPGPPKPPNHSHNGWTNNRGPVSCGRTSAIGDVDVALGSTTRNDETEQLTINGRPVYLFAGDAAPGDTNGHGLFDVWWVVGLDGDALGGVVNASESTLGTGAMILSLDRGCQLR
ncbi:MAG: hypothetical protein IIA27_15670 [Gemmatimonadetes bacterium]|nr:hypothetical protein [Gemmatimonadota bacterium]